MTMAISGHPVKALRADPKFSKDGSITLKKQVYTIDGSSTDIGLSREETYMFFVQRILIFNFAYPGVNTV